MLRPCTFFLSIFMSIFMGLVGSSMPGAEGDLASLKDQGDFFRKAATLRLTSTGVATMDMPGPAGSQQWVSSITDFLIARAQQEVFMSILSTVKEKLSDEKVSALFPESVGTISTLKASQLNYPGWSMLRTALQADIPAMPSHIDSLFPESDKLVPIIHVLQVADTVYRRHRSGSDGGSQVDDFDSVMKAITTIANEKVNGSGSLGASVRFLGIMMALVSQCHQPGHADNAAQLAYPAADSDKFMAVVHDLVALVDVNGVNALNIELQLQRPLYDVLVAADGLFRKEASSLPASVTSRSEAMEAIRTYREHQSRIDRVLMAWGKLHSLIALDVRTSFALTKKDGPSEEDRLLERILPLVSDFNAAVIAAEYERCAIDGITMINLLEAKRIPPSIGRWVAIAGQVTDASTEGDRQSFLTHVTDPLSDYLNKRTVDESYFCLNAYLGAAAGTESVAGHQGHAAVIQGFAPVGFEYGESWNAPLSYTGIFASVVDFGKLASARVRSSGEQSTVGTSSSSASKILAPGAFLVFGLSRTTPISLGFGAEYSPELRTDAVGRKVDAFQALVFLAIDIPLLEF